MVEYHATVAPNGRLVIPAGLRKAMGLAKGGAVLLRLEADGVRLETIDDSIRRAQALVRAHARAEPSPVEELIAERHAAARDE